MIVSVRCCHWLAVLVFLLFAAFPRAYSQEVLTKEQRQMQRLTRWSESRDSDTRSQAASELLKLQRPEVIPLLVKLINDPVAEVRVAVASGAAPHKDPRMVEALRARLKDDNDRVRAGAARTLSLMNDRASIPELVRLAEEDLSPLVRFRVIWGLGTLGDKQQLPVAIAALGDRNPGVRDRAAVIAIEMLGDQTLIPHLLRQTVHPQRETRRLVMYLLAKHGDRTVVPALRQGLKDPEPVVRGQAALAIGRLRAKEARDELVVVLTDSDDHVRGAAAYALGLLGDKAVTLALRGLVKDEAAFVRAIAAESLNRLGDQTVKPPAGFRAVELFTFPIHSPEHADLYR